MLIEDFLGQERNYAIGLDWHFFSKGRKAQKAIFIGAQKNKPSAFISGKDGSWLWGLASDEELNKPSAAATFAQYLASNYKEDDGKVFIAIERLGVDGQELYWVCAIQNSMVLVNTDVVIAFDQVAELVAEIEAIAPEPGVEYWGGAVSEFIYDNIGNAVAGKKLEPVFSKKPDSKILVKRLKDPMLKSYIYLGVGLVSLLVVALVVLMWPEKKPEKQFTPTQEMLDQVAYESDILPVVKESMEKVNKSMSAKSFVQMIDQMGVLKIAPWYSGWKVENISCNTEGCEIVWANQGEGSVVDLKSFYQPLCPVEDTGNAQARCVIKKPLAFDELHPKIIMSQAQIDELTDEFNSLEQVIKDFGAKVSPLKSDPVPSNYPQFAERVASEGYYMVDEGRWSMAGNASEFLLVISRLKNEEVLSMSQMNLSMTSINFSVSGVYYAKK